MASRLLREQQHKQAQTHLKEELEVAERARAEAEAAASTPGPEIRRLTGDATVEEWHRSIDAASSFIRIGAYTFDLPSVIAREMATTKALTTSAVKRELSPGRYTPAPSPSSQQT